jgi:hypothetical protein
MRPEGRIWCVQEGVDADSGGHGAGKRICCSEAFVCSVFLCREQGRAVPKSAPRVDARLDL